MYQGFQTSGVQAPSVSHIVTSYQTQGASCANFCFAKWEKVWIMQGLLRARSWSHSEKPSFVISNALHHMSFTHTSTSPHLRYSPRRTAGRTLPKVATVSSVAAFRKKCSDITDMCMLNSTLERVSMTCSTCCFGNAEEMQRWHNHQQMRTPASSSGLCREFSTPSD